MALATFHHNKALPAQLVLGKMVADAFRIISESLNSHHCSSNVVFPLFTKKKIDSSLFLLAAGKGIQMKSN
jgi:hypothetical protein